MISKIMIRKLQHMIMLGLLLRILVRLILFMVLMDVEKLQLVIF